MFGPLGKSGDSESTGCWEKAVHLVMEDSGPEQTELGGILGDYSVVKEALLYFNLYFKKS